jgi:hypothetical protein
LAFACSASSSRQVVGPVCVVLGALLGQGGALLCVRQLLRDGGQLLALLDASRHGRIEFAGQALAHLVCLVEVGADLGGQLGGLSAFVLQLNPCGL